MGEKHTKAFDAKKAVKDIVTVVLLPTSLKIILILIRLFIGSCATFLITDEISKTIVLWAEKSPGKSNAVILLSCGFILAIIIMVIVPWFKSLFREKIFLIEMSSLNKMQIQYNQEEESNYIIKHISVNCLLETNLEQCDEQIRNSVYDALKVCNQAIEKILSSRRSSTIGFAGIAHIPLIFYLGYSIGDENETILFHKDRDAKDFTILQPASRNDTSILNTEIIQQGKAGSFRQLVVAISLSLEVTEKDLSTVATGDDYIVSFRSSDGFGFDVINSMTKARMYANKIYHDVTKIEKEINPSKIVLCIAASSDFTFLLGTKFSRQQNGKVVVYHYQNPYYHWGIEMRNKDVVINPNI